MAIKKEKVIKALVEYNNMHQAHPVHSYLTKAVAINKTAMLRVNESGLISVVVNKSQVTPVYVPQSQLFGVFVKEQDDLVEYNVKLKPLLDKMIG